MEATLLARKNKASSPIYAVTADHPIGRGGANNTSSADVHTGNGLQSGEKAHSDGQDELPFSRIEFSMLFSFRCFGILYPD